jgi:hypothetical protein
MRAPGRCENLQPGTAAHGASGGDAPAERCSKSGLRAEKGQVEFRQLQSQQNVLWSICEALARLFFDNRKRDGETGEKKQKRQTAKAALWQAPNDCILLILPARRLVPPKL